MRAYVTKVTTYPTTMAALRVLGGGRGIARGENVTNEAVLPRANIVNEVAGS